MEKRKTHAEHFLFDWPALYTRALLAYYTEKALPRPFKDKNVK